MNTEALALIAGPHVIKLFGEYPTGDLIYHNLDHTRLVADRALEIAQAMQMTPHDTGIVLIAAWFHDTGHLNGGIEDHELRSVQFMKEFLREQGVEDEATIQAIADCIMSTVFPHEPTSLLDKIIEDADTYHFGLPEMRDTNEQVKEELILRGYKKATKGWRRHTLGLLMSHSFQTDYCRSLLTAGKEENIRWAKQQLEGKKGGAVKQEEKNKKSDKKEKTVIPPHQPHLAEDKLVAKQKNSLVARGLQTMLKLASENQVELSNLADGKANILISVNAIIISVILSVLIRRLEIDTHLTIPTIIFLTSSVVTVVIAILATRPKLTEGSFTREDIISKKTNLLFFGNFYKSTLEEYQWAMDRLMMDKDYIYGSLVKDIYFLGVVLGRKYKLIRLAYNIFMIGIVVSVIAFTLAVLLKNPQNNITVTNGTTPPL